MSATASHPTPQAHQRAIIFMIVAAICFTVMEIDVLKHLFFVFPELLLWVLAICLLMGRYSGYRLLELVRARVLDAILGDPRYVARLEILARRVAARETDPYSAADELLQEAGIRVPHTQE